MASASFFTITVGVYLVATIATGFSWDFWSFMVFRFLTGMGIGGEYGAVNSAIQELIPARRRGFTDLVINGSFWIGAALGAVGSIIVLDPNLVPQEWGWRAAFIIGGLLALIIIWVRRYIPESPRWLMTHGRPSRRPRRSSRTSRRAWFAIPASLCRRCPTPPICGC